MNRIFFQKLTFLILGFITAFLISEWIVRTFQLSLTWSMKQEEKRKQEIIRKYIDDYDAIGYRYLPHSTFLSVRDKTYHINSLGFRDNSTAFIDTNTVKVSVIGDSVFEGFGVDETDRATSIFDSLATELAVKNYRHRGYSTLDALAVFEKHVIKTQPDYVLLQLCFNDFEHNYLLAYPTKTEQKATNSINFKSLMQNHSALYLFAAEKYSYYKLTKGISDNFISSISNIEQKELDVTFRLLIQFRDTCIKHGIVPVITYVPYQAETQINDTTKSLYFSTLLAEFCKKNSIEYINLTSALLQTNDKELYFDHCHLNEKGNEIVGVQLTIEFENRLVTLSPRY